MHRHKKIKSWASCYYTYSETEMWRGTKSFSDGLFKNKELPVSDALSDESVESITIIHANLMHTAARFIISIIIHKEILISSKKRLNRDIKTVYFHCLYCIYILAFPCMPLPTDPFHLFFINLIENVISLSWAECFCCCVFEKSGGVSGEHVSSLVCEGQALIALCLHASY